MSLSMYTLDWFDVAHWELHIQQGLQSVGKTQFGTIYWSLDSVVQGIPAFTKIVHNADLGIDNLVSWADNERDCIYLYNHQTLHSLFDDDKEVFTFQRDLKWLGAILMPFACAIQCLEAKDTNPADVYTYQLAIVAHLHDLMMKDDGLKEKSQYSVALKEKIHAIANYWFLQLIENE